MRKSVVINATGPDNPGVLFRITGIIVKYNGNIELSRMTHLAGEFTLLILISMDEVDIPGLEKALGDHYKEERIHIAIRIIDDLAKYQVEGFVPYDLEVRGCDRPGIVLMVAELLYNRGINILSQESQINQGVYSCVPLFSMTQRILVPPDVAFNSLREELDQIEEEANVKIDIDLADF